LRPDQELLENAYDDKLGVTAEFNRNLLRRAERELGARVDPESFQHRADYNREKGRIEMRLVSEKTQTIEVDGESFAFDKGDAILTEYSHKFTVEGFARLASEAGFEERRVWMDDEELFSVHYLQGGPDRPS
jgi:uncharacterized SAM-dependent methyltransferase